MPVKSFIQDLHTFPNVLQKASVASDYIYHTYLEIPTYIVPSRTTQ